jgi:hypothetical protein
LDNAGNIYGTTYDTVFKLDTASKLTTLYTFCSEKNCSDGEGAWGLVRDTAGNLYGTTKYGGVTCKGDPFGDGCGVVFKLTP